MAVTNPLHFVRPEGHHRSRRHNALTVEAVPASQDLLLPQSSLETLRKQVVAITLHPASFEHEVDDRKKPYAIDLQYAEAVGEASRHATSFERLLQAVKAERERRLEVLGQQCPEIAERLQDRVYGSLANDPDSEKTYVEQFWGDNVNFYAHPSEHFRMQAAKDTGKLATLRLLQGERRAITAWRTEQISDLDCE